MSDTPSTEDPTTARVDLNVIKEAMRLSDTPPSTEEVRAAWVEWNEENNSPREASRNRTRPE